MLYGNLDLRMSVIGYNTKIRGDLFFETFVRIDGEVDGSINCETEILLSKTSKVSANIHTKNLTLEGNLEGTVVAENFLVKSGAVFTGTVKSKNFTIENGACVNLKAVVA